jgi:DNA adenine methylase
MLISVRPQQESLFREEGMPLGGVQFKTQLLKWIGNKQRQAVAIIAHFPERFGTYYEPFVGSGGVLGVLAPKKGVASDAFGPLIEIWQTLHDNKVLLKRQYTERFKLISAMGKKEAYEHVLARYNARPNGADLVFLCRACYGGVVRFRRADGYMSTPVGAHNPVVPESFSNRVDLWHERTKGTRFLVSDFSESMLSAKRGDLVYCDPPYTDSQAILYGAQAFSLERLLQAIAECKARGVFVALSIDGTKFSGRKLCDVPVPSGLFEREVFVQLGRSMLKRFQMDGRSLEHHEVSDRLLLTY